MIKPAWSWVRGRWNALNAVLALLSIALGALALAQWSELHRQHRPPNWGNVPEWVAAAGSFAAFTALAFAAREWKAGQEEHRSLERERQAADAERRALAATRDAERLDHEMSQARLVIVEPVDKTIKTFSGPTRPNLANADVLIHNCSASPVFALHIDDHPAGNDAVTLFQYFARGPGPPIDHPVLAAGEATPPIMVSRPGEQPTTESVQFTFVDALGTRWRRLGNRLPEKIIGELHQDSIAAAERQLGHDDDR